ncbi:HesA/MoeB/ThiF family protein [Geobacter sulfurreducens]|uniref:HesA/MoeB/ThiF family protein n=1 Tax=Geobacter sulfurreducens TaxID=35554 RepID=UPI001BDC6B81|nr:HesA/MoeB/ThiF family protein [Geobacter sulfurreducens]QVW36152.1 HesA/MoeB/ThiF family protein [Geobacter sulfurreducens]UTG93591.1 HesA/MoeB/ThiF family protein [Geobacter sulfurreducens]
MTGGERYSRQVLVWGEENQRTLERSAILIAGVGGLGATVAQLMARAGVGRLYLADHGVVDWPDLNRQLLYDEGDVGQKKVAVAVRNIMAINGAVQAIPLDVRIDDAFTPPAGINCVADCLDNFAGRSALFNSLADGTLLIHGAIQGDHGQVLTLVKGVSRPLDEIFAGSRQPAGPIPVTPAGPAVIAGYMAHELTRAIRGGPGLADRVLVVDLTDYSCSFLDV